MINIFIPLKKIGEFELGTNINIYKDKYMFKYTEKDISTGWETYSSEQNNISLFVENNIIVSIVCEVECFFNKMNIIGIDINYFLEKNNLHFDDFQELYISDSEIQQVYDFDDLGLQVWCAGKKIISIIASQNNS